MNIKKEKVVLNVIFENSFNEQIYKSLISNSICAVIDILRATSSTAAILESGCKSIMIAENKKKAFALKNIFGNYLLCGEENGLPPEGFDYGNSPYEFSNLDLSDKKIILMTTNGTVSFFKLLHAKIVFALSLLNMTAVLKKMAELAIKNNMDILLLCSGKRGVAVYDDTFGAGVAIKKLSDILEDNCTLSDSAYIVSDMIKNNPEVTEAFKKSLSGKDVLRAGQNDDFDFCTKTDIYKAIPVLKVINKKYNDLNLNTEHKNILDKISLDREFEKILLIEPFKSSDNL